MFIIRPGIRFLLVASLTVLAVGVATGLLVGLVLLLLLLLTLNRRVESGLTRANAFNIQKPMGMQKSTEPSVPDLSRQTRQQMLNER